MKRIRIISQSSIPSHPFVISTRHTSKLKRTVGAFDLQCALKDNLYQISVPAGYLYNGSSIPPMLWGIFGTPYSPINDTPGCVHDFLYDRISDGQVICNGMRVTVSRETADEIFYHLLIYCGVPRSKARMMELGVKFGGKKYYKK